MLLTFRKAERMGLTKSLDILPFSTFTVKGLNSAQHLPGSDDNESCNCRAVHAHTRQHDRTRSIQVLGSDEHLRCSAKQHATRRALSIITQSRDRLQDKPTQRAEVLVTWPKHHNPTESSPREGGVEGARLGCEVLNFTAQALGHCTAPAGVGAHLQPTKESC